HPGTGRLGHAPGPVGGPSPRWRLAPLPGRANVLPPAPARGLVWPGMRLSRLGAWCGVMGPVLFTAAWVVSSLRQTGHSATEVQLSGLAADEARDPQIMVAGFVVLGVCSIGFGIAFRRVLSPRAAGAWLVIVAGAAAVAAGVFRRDHLL